MALIQWWSGLFIYLHVSGLSNHILHPLIDDTAILPKE